MKIRINKKLVLVFAAVLACVLSCTMVVMEIILPEDARTDSTETISVKLDIACGNDYTNGNTLIVGMLFPTEWNVASTATAKVSTSGLQASKSGIPDLNNVPMHLVSPDKVEKISQMPYSAAFMSRFGDMGNYDSVEWVVFESDTYVILSDDSHHIITTVDITLKTGSSPLRYYTAVAFCGSEDGFMDNDRWGVSSKVAMTVTVNGDDADVNDYTMAKFVTTQPQQVRYGDIFRVNFFSYLDLNIMTDLSGQSDIYLCGNAILEDGTVVKIDKADQSNKMDQESTFLFTKYIYPRSFFGLKMSDKITELYVFFRNEAGTIYATSPDNPLGWKISEKGKSIFE